MAVQTITYPVHTSVQAVVSTIKNTWNSYINLIEVNEENKLLKQQLLNMEEKLNQHIENSVQFFRLRSQLLFAQKKPAMKYFQKLLESLQTTLIRFA